MRATVSSPASSTSQARAWPSRARLGRVEHVLLGDEPDQRRDTGQRQQPHEHRGPDEEMTADATAHRGAAVPPMVTLSQPIARNSSALKNACE